MLSLTNASSDIPAVASTNTATVTNKTEEITRAEEFEGLHKEKLQEVTDTTTNTATEELDFNWDLRWDNGLRYQLNYKHPVWAVLYFNSREKETKLDGKIGLKLDIDAVSYNSGYSMPEFDEGIYIRRARLYTAGYFFYIFPAFYKAEMEIADGKFFIREIFLWLDNVPVIQTVKIGHFKAPSTLDNMISSRDRIFMESATPVEAFSQGIKNGIQISDSLENQRATWAVGWFANGNSADINDASKSISRLLCRATYLPIDNRDAKLLCHIGYSGSFIYTENKDVQYHSRPESYLAPRLVDTGKIEAHNANIQGVELAVIDGAFSFQSEFIRSDVNANGENLSFYGAYGEWGWFLTGESRPYLRDTGTFGQIIPKNNFSSHSHGWGAWEIAVRHSYLDLTDKDTDGGRISTTTAGLNWYLNRIVTLRINIGYSDIKGGATPGYVKIAQARWSINF